MDDDQDAMWAQAELEERHRRETEALERSRPLLAELRQREREIAADSERFAKLWLEKYK